MICSQKAVGIMVALIVAALTVIIVFDRPVGLLVRDTSVHSTGTVKAATCASSLQYVRKDKILDENGREITWRGAGGSYLFHTDDYMLAWEKHLLELQKMGLNTVRLAFRFPDSSPGDNGYTAADTLDHNKLDQILDFLDEHGIKTVLDCHNYKDMYGDFGSQKLIDDWMEVAKHYRGDSRIVAYELFNEPFSSTWDSWLKTKTDVVKAYADLTKAVRKVDPEHIIIWQSSNYLPSDFPAGLTEYLQSNIVYTTHRWWTRKREEFDIWTPEQISYMTLGHLVQMRQKLNAPFWLGEFGAHQPFDSSNPEWVLTEQNLFRCEEQVIGWNLWMGRTGINRRWNCYLPFFPLKVYNANLIRQSWQPPAPNLTGYIIDQHEVDRLELYRIEMWHNNDYVTFKSGIIIYVIINHKLSDGSVEIVSKEKIQVTKQLTIRNEEGTAEHPGDWNIIIYPCASL
jgi:hypothetical protein